MNCLSFNYLADVATIRSNRKFKEPAPVVFTAIFFLLNCHFVATSITWTAPRPQWLQTDPNEIRTVNISVLIGSTQEALRWSYTLPAGVDRRTTRFRIIKDVSDVIGSIFHDSGGDNYVIRNVNDYQTRFNISRSEMATLIINRITEREEAVYQCEIETKAGDTWKYSIHVTVAVPASLTNVSPDQTVNEDSKLQLFCNASGKPSPNITWTRVLEDGSNGAVLHQGQTWDFLNINRTATGAYRCTAYNGFGNEVNKVLNVNVTYPAMVVSVSASKRDVEVQESVSFQCTAEGNPQPTYSWIPCDPPQVCHKSKLDVSEVMYDDVYICTAKNYLGSNSGNVSVFIAGKVINITLVITSESCTNGKYNQSSLWIKLNNTFDVVFVNDSTYNSSQLTDVRCGSVTTDLRLKFNSIIRETVVINTLRNAALNGVLVEVKVNVSSIKGTRPVIEKPTQAATTTPSSPSESKMWIIVGAVLGSLALLVVAGVVAWCVYRKRKCKKRDTKEVHNNGSHGEEGENVQGEGYVEVNKGYEDRANRHPGVIPAVYDTAQTGKRGAAKGQPVAEYAVVDKSKKKPRKPKPGELQYAELGEFSTGQGGQRSSLSPTNRHTETQYADVNAM